MDLKQFNYFLAVYHCSSFTRAANELYISQPALTTSIKNLEDELGVTLFDRSNKREITLTAEGRVFLRNVENVMKSVSTLVNELHSGAAVSITVVVSPLLAPKVIPLFLSRVPREGLKLRFLERSGSHLLEAVRDGTADAAVTWNAGVSQNPEYESIPFLEGGAVGISAENSGENVCFFQEDELVFGSDYYSTLPPKQIFHAEGLSISTILAMARRGICKAVLPDFFSSGPLQRLLLPGDHWKGYLFWKQSAYHSVNLQVLLNYLNAIDWGNPNAESF